MTPKIIHFIWLGGQPKPPIVERCLESWRRFCPGWEIREWDDAAIVGIDNRYLREALRAKKWAFAADYVRLYALDRFGGYVNFTEFFAISVYYAVGYRLGYGGFYIVKLFKRRIEPRRKRRYARPRKSLVCRARQKVH